MKKQGAAGRGRTAKHTAAAKHTHGKGKHHPANAKASHHQHTQAHVHTVGKPAGKARGLAITFGDTACCAAEALGASLRLAGWPVGQDDVLALHEAAGGSPDAGVTIQAVLSAALARGLAGVRPRSFVPVDIAGRLMFRAGQILGLELPGPHCVVQAGDGCWISWGEHYDPAEFPGAVLEEAWEVCWPPC